VNGVLLAS